MQHFDYIFAGGGLSAQLTAMRMAESGFFKDKSILMIDPVVKDQNDRTWSFWESGSGEFDSILSKSWEIAQFRDRQGGFPMHLSPWRYKMIQSGTFYRHSKEKLSSLNLTLVHSQVMNYRDEGEVVVVDTPEEAYTCSKLFNSIYDPKIPEGHRKFPLLKQHFLGWFVRTEKPAFNPELPVFMDFSVHQQGNTRFMYVLPVSETEALVEYTLFSHELLQREEYESAIAEYLSTLGAGTFSVEGSEQGAIPMTSYPFWEHNTRNIINIGSAGGWTKASTGYTFRNAARKSKELVAFIVSGGDFRKFHRKPIHYYYDMLLLDILDGNNSLGSTIFSSMFRNADARLIFKFLDEETTLREDLRVILSCPKLPFLKVFFRRLLSL